MMEIQSIRHTDLGPTAIKPDPTQTDKPNMGLGYHELSGPAKMQTHTAHAGDCKMFSLGFVVQSCFYDSDYVFCSVILTKLLLKVTTRNKESRQYLTAAEWSREVNRAI